MLKKKVIGIDLGGTTTKFAILNHQGVIQEKWSIQTDISEKGSNIVPNIIKSINSKLKLLNLNSDYILGIGMGSPGTVNRKDGIVKGAYNLNWKDSQDLKRPIERETKISFVVDNDANVAALGEKWVGAGNNKPNVVFITLGTGVGGGIISDGSLLHGAHDSAGEIGHITVEPDGYLCTCGKQGCLEQYASATGIVRMAYDLAEEYTGLSRLKDKIDDGQEVDSEIIFELAKADDKLALIVVDQFVYYLSFSLGIVANILNPSVIVLGGGVSKAGEFLVEKLKRKIKPLLLRTIRDITEIKIAELGNDAGVIGAASLVLNEL